MDSAMLRKEFQAQKKKIQLTKKQLYLVQNKMKETEKRAAWAERADKMNFRSVLQMKMMALEGFSQYLHHYMHCLEEQLDFIKAKMIWADCKHKYQQNHICYINGF